MSPLRRKAWLYTARHSTTAGMALALACASGASARPAPAVAGATVASGEIVGRSGTRQAAAVRLVGIALAAHAATGELSATGAWRLTTLDGRSVVRGTGRGAWTVERRGHRLHIASRGSLSATRDAPLIAQSSAPDAFVTWDGKPYRGSIEIFVVEAGMLVVNRLPVEDYLRGVVPLEMGVLGPAERAALEAQAVAARSYTYVRLDDPDMPAGGRRYDLVATVADQVYGGVAVETPLADTAVAATVDEVIMYGGHVVNAPYHAACGGTTAEPEDVWHEAAAPYLRRVSDQIPGTDHYYCEGSAHFRWTRTLTRAELSTTLSRYLREYARPDESGQRPSTSVPPSGSIGTVRSVAIEAYSPSGRVASLAVTTSRRTYHVWGNDIRFVLRAPDGEILHSTYFVIEGEPVGGGGDGVASLTLAGRGNGHGVGMCQWGAIGRARAGQDYRTILQTYYPGTTLVREH